MNYIQLDCYCSNSKRDSLIAFLANIGFEGFVENDDGFSAFIPENMYTNSGIKKDIDELRDFHNCDFGVKIVEDRNWNELWESTIQPVIIDDLVAIRATFHPSQPNVKHEIIIDPKMSFGTGHHPTTLMMAKMMFVYNLKDEKILDFGCGTGILSILAAKSGAGKIDAIDIDYWAFENTKENLLLNHVDNITPLYGGKEVIPQTEYGVILANINKNVICDTLQLLSNRLKNGGILITSGYYSADLKDINAEAKLFDLKAGKKLELDDWNCVSFIKKSN